MASLVVAMVDFLADGEGLLVELDTDARGRHSTGADLSH